MYMVGLNVYYMIFVYTETHPFVCMLHSLLLVEVVKSCTIMMDSTNGDSILPTILVIMTSNIVKIKKYNIYIIKI